MLVTKPRQVDPDRQTIRNPPFAADHHPVGTVSAAEHQRGNRIAGAGKPQVVQGEESEVSLASYRNPADIVAS